MNRFATRFRRLSRPTTMSGRVREYARAQHANQRRRLLLGLAQLLSSREDENKVIMREEIQQVVFVFLMILEWLLRL